jgi:hypothetical protein
MGCGGSKQSDAEDTAVENAPTAASTAAPTPATSVNDYTDGVLDAAPAARSSAAVAVSEDVGVDVFTNTFPQDARTAWIRRCTYSAELPQPTYAQQTRVRDRTRKVTAPRFLRNLKASTTNEGIGLRSTLRKISSKNLFGSGRLTSKGTPSALHMEGATAKKALAHMGTYVLCAGRRANGRPVYEFRYPPGEDGQEVVLAFSGHSWNVQHAEHVGESRGFLSVNDKCATPNLARGKWQVGSKGGWADDAGIRCSALDVELLPTPTALRLHQLPGDPRAALTIDTSQEWLRAVGHYRLLPRKHINGGAVWRQSSRNGDGCLLVRSEAESGGWAVLSATGGSGALLRLDDKTAAPHLSHTHWHHHGTPLPGLVFTRAPVLPRAADVSLFEDDFTHTQTHLTFRRPGRSDGLADSIDGLCLFGNSVSPKSLRQGGLGDCWLVSAFAAVAENASSITGLCAQRVANVVGRYDISLFDPTKEKWVTITVDDRLPIRPESLEGILYKDGSLQFTKLSRQDEMWPCIFEKAFASLLGGCDRPSCSRSRSRSSPAPVTLRCLKSPHCPLLRPSLPSGTTSLRAIRRT